MGGRACTNPPLARIRSELSVLRTALILLLLIVPGLAGTFALFDPDEIDPVTRLALVFAIGFAVDAAVAFVLMLAHVLLPWTWLALSIAVTAALVVMAVRRRLGPQLRAFAARVRAELAPLAGGAVVVCGIAVVRLGFSPDANFNAPVAFRYWADGLEIADAHRLPHLSFQWGSLFPPASSKVILNAFNGASSFVLGRDPLHALAPLLWIGSVGLVVALWAVGRELGLRVLAPLLPVVLVANRVVLNPEMTRDIDTYKAEAFGRMIAFAGLALALSALRDGTGRRRRTVVAGALFGVAAGTHLVPLAVVSAVVVWFGLAGLALGRGRVIVRTSGVLFGVAALVALAVLLLPRGDIGFEGVTAPGAYATFGPGFDPTTFLLTGKRPPAGAATPSSRSSARPTDIVTRFFSEGLGIRASLAVSAMIAVAGLLVAVAMLLWFPPTLRAVGLTAWGTALAFIVVAIVFGGGFHVMILAQFGRRRLSDYASLPWILVGLGVLEGGVAILAKRRAAVTVVAALVIVASVPFVWSARPPSGAASRGARAIPVLAMVRRATGCDARILANRRTIATFESMTGRAGLVEGMAPYLRPSMLLRAVTVIEEAERFFHDPSAWRSVLSREDVGYVLLVDRSVPFGPLAGPIDGSSAALDSAPFLRLTAADGPSRLYRVVGVPLAPRPGPGGRPGYRCERSGAP